MSERTSDDPDLTAVNNPVQTRLNAAQSNAGPLSDRYVLGEILARGGMGEVYDARDTLLNRRVAIKVIQTRFANSDSILRRFLDEAAIASQIQHPGVPPVHDLGTLPDGRPFLVMKLIKGRTLAEDLKSRSTPAEDQPRFIQTFEQICQTLAYAHSHSVIHRDLKPLNVMVGAFGEVQVMDWGVAKVLTEGMESSRVVEPQPAMSVIETSREPDSATQAGSVVGTWGYMPPEQARGEVEKMNARSDVFSLGGILCEILTGAPAYSGTLSEVRAKAELGLVEDAMARLDSCGAEPEIAALAKQCLAKESAARPADAGIVAGFVAKFRAGMEERLRKAERDQAAAAARAAEQRRKRRVQMALAAALAVILFGGGAFAWWNDKQAGERRSEREANALREEIAKDKLEREAAERQTREAEAFKIGEARNAEAIESLLAQCAKALGADDAATADIAFKEAERRRGDGKLKESVERLFARCRVDLELLVDLDRVNDARIEDKKRKWSSADTDQATIRVDAFLDNSEETLRPMIAESLIRERLMATLDRDYNTIDRYLAMMNLLDPDPFRKEVRLAMARGDLNRLAELAERPESLDQPARFALAMLSRYDGIKNKRRRFEILKSALARSPNDYQLLIELGTEGDDPDATSTREDVKRLRADSIAAYRSAVAVRPWSARAWRSLGNALARNDRLEEALRSLRKAIELDPANSAGHLAIATVAQARPNWLWRPLGIAAYDAAMRVDPSTREQALIGIAWFFQQKGDHRTAIDVLQELAFSSDRLRGGPASGRVATYWRMNAERSMGECWVELKEIERATDCFRRAARLDVERLTSLTTLIAHLKAHGSSAAVAEAQAAFRDEARRCFDENPRDAGERYSYARALAAQQMYVQALDEYATLAATSPNLETRGEVAEGHRILGRRAEAIASYRRLLADRPGYYGATQALAEVLAENGNNDEAAEVIRGANFDGLAWTLATSRFTALRNGRKAVRLAFADCESSGWKDASAVDTLAAAHAEAGDFTGAVMYAERALAMGFTPEDGMARLALYVQRKPFRQPGPTEEAPPPREAK